MAAVKKLITLPHAISVRLSELNCSQFFKILYPAAAVNVGMAKKKENSKLDRFNQKASTLSGGQETVIQTSCK